MGDVADQLRNFRSERPEAGVLVAVESVYSMDGDEAPLEALAALCLEDGRAALVVDEAHATGVLGPQGRGAVASTVLRAWPCPWSRPRGLGVMQNKTLPRNYSVSLA